MTTAEKTQTGLWTIFRLMLRRDRVRTSVWILAVGACGYIFASALTNTYASEQDVHALAMMLADPVMRMLVGPSFGLADPSHQVLFSAAYVLFIYLPIALFSIFTVVRHTRAEEETGRAELVRSNVVGRNANLTATLVLTTASNVLIALLIILGVLAVGFDVEGTLLVGVGGFAVGLFFTGVAAVTAQLSESARTSTAMASAVLGIAYLIRLVGDMPEESGTALSWFSPLAWPQQTAPYVDDRWWPLILPSVGAVILIWLGIVLSTRRDVGAGMIHARLGRAEALPYLGTPVGMAYRTLRGGLRGWGIALVLTGLIFGGFAQAMVDTADDLPSEMALIFSGDDIMLGYLAFMGVFVAILVAAAGVSGLKQVRGEETKSRAEYTLSAPISRTSWFGSQLLVLIAGVAVILVLTGLAMGLGTVASLKDGGSEYAGPLLLATALQLAPTLAVIGIVAAFFGLWPKAAAPVGWILVGYSALVTSFADLLDMPHWMVRLSLFSHLSNYPVDDVSWPPVLWLTAIALTGIFVGLLGWCRRDVNGA